jgi:hypothetical protein
MIRGGEIHLVFPSRRDNPERLKSFNLTEIAQTQQENLAELVRGETVSAMKRQVKKQ